MFTMCFDQDGCRSCNIHRRSCNIRRRSCNIHRRSCNIHRRSCNIHRRSCNIHPRSCNLFLKSRALDQRIRSCRRDECPLSAGHMELKSRASRHPGRRPLRDDKGVACGRNPIQRIEQNAGGGRFRKGGCFAASPKSTPSSGAQESRCDLLPQLSAPGVVREQGLPEGGVRLEVVKAR